MPDMIFDKVVTKVTESKTDFSQNTKLEKSLKRLPASNNTTKKLSASYEVLSIKNAPDVMLEQTDDNQSLVDLRYSNDMPVIQKNDDKNTLKQNMSENFQQNENSTIDDDSLPREKALDRQTQVPIATTNTTIVNKTKSLENGSLNDLSTSAAPPSEKVDIVSDKISGNYFSHPTVALTFTEGGAGVITYCLSYNGICCDLSASSLIYSEPILVGEQGNGQYCLKYSGQTYSGVDIEEKEQQFTIYSTVPTTPITATQTLYLQTTQKNTFIFPKITYGEVPTPDLILSIYNLNSSPSGTCSDIADSIPPMDLNADGVPDYIDFISYLMEGLNLLLYSNADSLHYGENYVVSLITKTALDDVRHTCSISQVHIEDFPIFENYSVNRMPASLPLDDETELNGGFSPFGHFSNTDNGGHGKPCTDGLCFGMFGSLY